MAKSKRRFATKNGVVTDVMHSYEDWYKLPYRKRQANAFDKKFFGELTDRDKYLMRGYAQRVVDEQSAFRYNNPNYVRKTSNKKK